jgi:hypothetical protein
MNAGGPFLPVSFYCRRKNIFENVSLLPGLCQPKRTWPSPFPLPEGEGQSKERESMDENGRERVCRGSCLVWLAKKENTIYISSRIKACAAS